MIIHTGSHHKTKHCEVSVFHKSAAYINEMEYATEVYALYEHNRGSILVAYHTYVLHLYPGTRFYCTDEPYSYMINGFKPTELMILDKQFKRELARTEKHVLDDTLKSACILEGLGDMHIDWDPGSL